MNNTTDQDENQRMLAESAQKYAERGYTAETRAASLAHAQGCAPDRWREFAEFGWLALPLAGEHGGLDGSLPDLCTLAENLGGALIVEPWIASAVLAPLLLAAAGSPEQNARWLPALAAGEKRIAFAAWESGARFNPLQVTTRAERMDDAYRLHGDKELVLGAPGADALIVCARVADGAGAAGLALFLVDAAAPGLALQSYSLVDGRYAAHLRLDGVLLAQDARLDGAADVAQAITLALDQAMVVQCAETVGVMAKALAITLDYLKTRKQFGRILASNQALQHRLVDLHVAIEETRALVYAAAQSFATPGAQQQTCAAAAKATASQAARLVWEETVQMHGAIGMTDETQLCGTTRYLATAHTLYGDAEHHLERVVRLGQQLFQQHGGAAALATSA